ncbi:nitroreductase [Streptomyces cadmiisoli]|uniref:nitroreductase n=1 Tax=Streptomyces cadmiisoli TaxID=2184053 RepID=UPI00364785A1
MDVYEAVQSRRATRVFSDKPVPRETLERVMAAATRAPSSANFQPWRAFVVTGDPLAELKERVSARVQAGDMGEGPQYQIYPTEIVSPYRDRQIAAAMQMYPVVGVDRDDPDKTQKLAVINANAFGAPVAMFFYLDKTMPSGQWADLGMYLQTVMLLLRAEGLHSCAQVFWTLFHPDVAKTVGADDGLVQLCGLAVGFEAEGAPQVQTVRADMAETVSFIDR